MTCEVNKKRYSIVKERGRVRNGSAFLFNLDAFLSIFKYVSAGSAPCAHSLSPVGAGETPSWPLFYRVNPLGFTTFAGVIWGLSMIIKSCLLCRFHQVRREEKERVSYCQKEDCWAEFSECIMKKALNRFLEQESASLCTVPKIQPPR